MQKMVINCFKKFLCVFVFLFFGQAAFAENIYCRPLAAEQILKDINNKITSPFPFGFSSVHSAESNDNLQIAYNKIKIEKLISNDYQLVLITKDLNNISQHIVNFNSNLHKLFINCSKENGMQCEALALYNNTNKICLMYSVDDLNNGDDLLESTNKLIKQLYNFGN